MFRKNCGLLHVLLAAVCGLVVLMGSTVSSGMKMS